MKKILNTTETIIDDMIAGFLAAEGQRVKQSQKNSRVLYRKEKIPNKVGIVSGGGSGHEPLFLGLLGKNLVDSVAIGNIFAAPSPKIVCEAIKQADQGAGVICLFGNYAGDVLNFEMGLELAEIEGIDAVSIAIADDVASAPKIQKDERRGIAGDLFVIKEVAAAASIGCDLEKCKNIAIEANNRLFSIGVGISPGINPVSGKKNFDLAEDEIEFGLGIHGEPGIGKIPLLSASELVTKMYRELKAEVIDFVEKEVVICVNGLGSTTSLELYIINKELTEHLMNDGFTVHDTLIGSICTTQEMGGFSITIQVLTDELKSLYNLEAYSSAYFHKEKY